MKPSTVATAEPAHDILRRRNQPLDVFFSPQTVAVIGASESPGSFGRLVLSNLIQHPFGGAVYPINPRRSSVLGIRSYRDLQSAPTPSDLAVIVTPAPTVPDVLCQCVDTGVKGAIILSAGFRETGQAGADLERRCLAEARRGNLRLIGPNCLGVMSPLTGLNATLATGMARPGNVAFLSQSGALCTAILDWSLREMVGFSAFVSVGSMLDVGWGDLISYLGDDPQTRSIVIYMETIADARAFLSAAREVALSKPVIVIKAGRTEAAAKAASTHTGALSGSDEVLDAAFRRCGALRVNNVAELFYMADVLSKQPRPEGDRLYILTNAGGPGVLAADAVIAAGGTLAQLPAETAARLDTLLPAGWSRANPVDILGDAGPDRYVKAMEIIAADPGGDGVLVILAPQAQSQPTQTAEQLRPFARLGKPVLASWMGGVEVAAGQDILNRAGIPAFPYPDTAARLFHLMWSYSENLRGLYETPVPLPDGDEVVDRRAAAELVSQVRDAGRTMLTEIESKALLAAYGLPVVPTRSAKTAEEAVQAANAIGYPVVVKLQSHVIAHKAAAAGVYLNLSGPQEVRHAFESTRAATGEGFDGVSVQRMVTERGREVILGSSVDPHFGPVILFGAGGELVEVFRDRALGLPPLTTTLALRMMERTRIYEALGDHRQALAQLLVRFSQLVLEQPAVREIDVNPVLVCERGVLALDARVILYPAGTPKTDLPKPAIRPYPAHYAGRFTMKNGETVTIRPIRPEDEPLMIDFHGSLSEETVYFRYFQNMRLDQRVAHERLTRICFIDYAREMALVVERQEPESGRRSIIAVGRLIRIHGADEAECAFVVMDRFQSQGLGTELMRRLLDIARCEGIGRVTADILPENRAMLKVARKAGFRLQYSVEAQLMKAEYSLPAA